MMWSNGVARGRCAGIAFGSVLTLVMFGQTPARVAAVEPQSLAGCPVFPDDNIWNVPVDTLPVHARSNDYVNSIGASTGVHPDFGSQIYEGAPIGIPFITVPGSQPNVSIIYTAYGDESDPGPYPVPAGAPIEGGSSSDGDRHVLVLDRDNCILYELYRAFPRGDGSWEAESGAKYDLSRNAPLRPDGWTSADAAGLPILPGLARYDEVAAGEIRHALRFTVPRSQRSYVWPARHFASSSSDSALPPMGMRFRLKSSFDISGYSPQVGVILQCLKRYGMIVADNGAAWYISGAPDAGWDDDALVSELRTVRGSDFEAVDSSSLMIDPNSGQARTGGGGDTRRLDVSVSGSGSVGSDPVGIDCPGDCAHDFANGTPVSVSSASASGWAFDHWEGDCSGTAPDCGLTMSANRSVTAVFSRLPGAAWISVRKPNGGERWPAGKKRFIRWGSSGVSGDVTIALSTTGGASWRTIVGRTANDGSHAWRVSSSRSTNCLIRIQSLDDGTVTDMSDRAFTIR